MLFLPISPFSPLLFYRFLSVLCCILPVFLGLLMLARKPISKPKNVVIYSIIWIIYGIMPFAPFSCDKYSSFFPCCCTAAAAAASAAVCIMYIFLLFPPPDLCTLIRWEHAGRPLREIVIDPTILMNRFSEYFLQVLLISFFDYYNTQIDVKTINLSSTHCG